MLKYAANLPEDYEYAIIVWGQSNARPWGSRDEGFAEASHLELEDPGVDLTIVAGFATTGTSRIAVTAGSKERGLTSVTIAANVWVDADLRLGTVTAPAVGNGIVTACNTAGAAKSIGFTNGSNKVEREAHGWEDGQPLLLSLNSATAPAGSSLSNGDYVYVANKTANTFEIEETVGGGSITFTDDGTPLTALAKDATFTNATNVVNIASHGYSDGQAIYFLLNGGTAPTGSSLTDEQCVFVVNKTANTFQIEASIGGGAITFSDDGTPSGTGFQFTISPFTLTHPITLTVTLDSDVTAADNTATSAWLTHESEKWTYYKSVRVLTSWLPDTSPQAYPTEAPVLPGGSSNPDYTVPSGITSYEDLGLFLNFTFNEGIHGPGLWDQTVTTFGANTFTLSGISDPEIYLNAYVRCRTFNASSELIDISYGTIASYAANVWTLAANWTGTQPDSVSGADSHKVDVWLPHYLNNPHLETAGYNFSQPSNDPQPFGHITNVQGKLHNVPNSHLVGSEEDVEESYGYSSSLFDVLGRFGMMLPFAWRLSQAIGKRVNIIHLGVNSAGIFEQAGRNQQGHPFEVGFWDPDKFLDWNPNRTDGSAARLKKMIQTIAPNAITAEGGTKPLRILGILGAQGEAETLLERTRNNYKNSLGAFYEWLADVIYDATDSNGDSLSYYGDRGKMPICHLGLPTNPWELSGTFYGATLAGDTLGLVNKAIKGLAAKRPYATTIDTNDSPSLANINLGTDPLHFNGEGEVTNGENAADALLTEIDAAVASEEDLSDGGTIEICNLALSYIGETIAITSLDPAVDTSEQAARCKRFYPLARETLLQRCSWSFATRRGTLDKITDFRDDEWSYAYGLPPNCVKLFTVLPPGAAGDVTTSLTDITTMQTATGYVTTNAGTGYVTRPFTVELDSDGHHIVYTDVDAAVARYNVLVTDTTLYPPNFKNALALMTASMLAGVSQQGEGGAAMSARLMQQAEFYLSHAETHDAMQHDPQPEHQVPWLVKRGARTRRH